MRLSEWARWVITMMALFVVLLAWDGTRQHTQDTEALICSTVRLVAYVPALQFEGESQRNFIGWIEARRDMLADVRQRGLCSPEDQRRLERRVAADEALLKELK